MTQKNINVQELQGMLNQGSPVTVLDVRRADEWSDWAIPGSLNVAVYDALKADDPAALDQVELPDDRPLVTV